VAHYLATLRYMVDGKINGYQHVYNDNANALRHLRLSATSLPSGARVTSMDVARVYQHDDGEFYQTCDRCGEAIHVDEFVPLYFGSILNIACDRCYPEVLRGL
jgi:hypothetical protein